jgi:mono/diheme cytochrome c family protein
MKNRVLLLLVMPMMLLASGCSNQTTLNQTSMPIASKSVTETPGMVVYPDDNPSIPDGKAVFQKLNCAQCHGEKGEAPVAMVKLENHVPPGSSAGTFALNDRNWASNQEPVREYVFLTYGTPGVKNHPIFKDTLTKSERWNLVFYVRSLAVGTLTDEEWAAVDPVWGSNCAVCHGKRGNGDGPLTKGMALEPVPANFHSFERFYARSDNDVFEHIAYGIPWEGMPNFLGKYDHKANVHFDQTYIRKLVQYVRAFHSTNKPLVTQ